MFVSGQDEHVSFFSHVRIFQVVQGFKQQPFASSATRLLPPPRGVLWNIYTKCTWNPHTLLLEYGDLHRCNVRLLCAFLLFTSLSRSSYMVLQDKLSHLVALLEARSLQGLLLGAAVRNPHQPSPLTKTASPADFRPPPSSFCTEISLHASRMEKVKFQLHPFGCCMLF